MRTLAEAHPDRAHDDVVLARALSAAKTSQRFLGLDIVEAGLVGEREGEVLFRARVFARGVDRSFVELSSFTLESGGWRYEGGLMVPTHQLPDGVASSRAAFRAHVSGLG